MRRRMLRRSVCILCLLATFSLAGCDMIGFLAYLFNPGVTETIESEYEGLAGHTVAVVVYADPETLFTHPAIPQNLSAVVSAHLEANLEDLTTVDSQRIWRYQESHTNWDATPMEELATVFEADYILYISLLEYGTRVPGSIDLYRGTMAAQVFLYDASLADAGDPEVWRSDLMGAQFPKDNTGGIPNSSDSDIAYAMNTIFAEELAKKFYEHEIDITVVETESNE
jgi:hypothetical protein